MYDMAQAAQDSLKNATFNTAAHSGKISEPLKKNLDIGFKYSLPGYSCNSDLFYKCLSNPRGDYSFAVEEIMGTNLYDVK